MNELALRGYEGIGSDIKPEYSGIQDGSAVTGMPYVALDITDRDAVISVINKVQPDVIVHCAAWTAVDNAEDIPEKVYKINALGTKNIAEACKKIDAKMFYISTDYVFDGNSTKPYLPTDKTNPLNNYGLTKLEGEEAVKKYCEKYYIIRTSWLYGHHGKNFVETMISLANKPELKVVDDQIGCPTWTVELANGIIKLINDKEYGIYHVCGSDSTSWYGFAKEIFSLLKINSNLQPCTTDKFPRPAIRPKYSIMDNDGICRNWKLALKDYLALRIEEEA
jgi:dTDP-4-dehydrorhamnose reductase